MTETLNIGDLRANLKAIKAARAIRTQTLCEATGLTSTTVTRFLAGVASMPVDKVEMLAAAMGCRLILAIDGASEEST